MEIENSAFVSLIETWILLETESAKLAAQRRTKQEIEEIKEASEAYAYKVQLNQGAVEEDLLFHLKIAETSKNTLLQSLMLIIRPDVINSFVKLNIFKNKHTTTAIEEHDIILEYIISQEPEKAAKAMRTHLKDFFNYSQRLKGRQGNGTNGTH